MLVRPTLEELLEKVESRYVLSILSAKRARQLVDGAQSLTEPTTPNHVTTAAEEIAEGKIFAVPGKHDDKLTIPLRPEVEIERRRVEEEKLNARIRKEMEEESVSRQVGVELALNAISRAIDENVAEQQAEPEPEVTETEEKESPYALETLIVEIDDEDDEEE